MGRIRSIKPDFPHLQELGVLSRDARLTFLLLWTVCDDHGRALANPRLLKGVLFPYDDIRLADIEGWLTELEGSGAIRQYSRGLERFIEVRNWLSFQKIDKPSAPKYPDPTEGDSVILASPREPSRNIALDRDEDRDRDRDGKGSAEGNPPAPTLAPELTLQPPAPAAPPASAPKKASPAKKTLLPENFELTGKRLDTAIRLLPEDCDALAEFEKFKAFHLGKGSVMASWDGAWSYWCSNARNRTDYARKKTPNLKDSADARRKAGWWQPGDPTGREDLA